MALNDLYHDKAYLDTGQPLFKTKSEDANNVHYFSWNYMYHAPHEEYWCKTSQFIPSCMFKNEIYLIKGEYNEQSFSILGFFFCYNFQ